MRKGEQGVIRRITYLGWIREGMLGKNLVGRSLDSFLEKTELDPIDRGMGEVLEVIEQGREFEEGK